MQKNKYKNTLHCNDIQIYNTNFDIYFCCRYTKKIEMERMCYTSIIGLYWLYLIN